MKIIEKIKKWPTDKKRIFSISVAVFLTILIIILNSAINIIWKESDQKDNSIYKKSQTKQIQESFSEIIDNTKNIFDDLKKNDLATTTEETTQIENTVNQTNSISSSSISTSSIVE
jgi:predicted PurR-regulated permease PerM